MDIITRSDKQANRLTIEISGIDWESCKAGDVYEGEVKVQGLVVGVGRELTKELLASKEETALRVQVGGQVYYKKGQPCMGHYKSLYGDIAIERNLYQTAHGGETICPLEVRSHLGRFGSATPLLAKVLAFRVSALTPGEVAADFEICHQVALAPSYIAKTAQSVGEIAVEKKAAWQLQKTGTDDAPVRVVATGMDGANMPMVDENYKQAMVGTITLYDGREERMATEYLAAMPEAGKAGFYAQFDVRVDQALCRYPQALHVALCDGERAHWDHIDDKYPEAIDILDVCHANEYLAKAAEVIFGTAACADKDGWYEYYRAVLVEEKDGAAQVRRELMRQFNRQALGHTRAAALDQVITYFHNNRHRMHYWQYRDWGLPIGSGVTEAACKTVIKSRFCRSGMRWKRTSGDKILQLRAIRLSRQWETFWFKVMRYAA